MKETEVRPSFIGSWGKSTEEQLIALKQYVKIVDSENAFAKNPDVWGVRKIDVDFLPSDKALIVSNKFKIYDPPVQHVDENGNPTSDALYYIDEHETPDGHIVYLSKLKPGAVTSKHQHPNPLREFCIPLFGTVFQEGEPMQPLSIINPFTDHHVTTGKDPAILLILTEHGASVPKGKRHIMQGITI